MPFQTDLTVAPTIEIWKVSGRQDFRRFGLTPPQCNRPDNLGDISDSGLILLKAKRVLTAIRHKTVPAHIRDHAVQRPKMVTTPNLAAVPLRETQIIETTRLPDRHFWHAGYNKAK